MKAKNLLAAIVVLTLPCAESASATVMKYIAMVTGDQQVPEPVVTDAFGKAWLKLDDVSRSLTVSLSVTGIDLGELIDVGPGFGPVHLHNAPAVSNGHVEVPFTFDAGGYTDTASALLLIGAVGGLAGLRRRRNW